ncbi:hypothetical protein ACSMXM_10460 [Pacificimonas sp. ICDLI1SI03]
MANYVNALVLDAALAELSGASALVALSGAPGGYAAADAGRLASVSVTAEDFTISDGVEDGRRITVAAKAGVSAMAGGTADHVALLDEGNATLLYVAECPAVVIAAGGTVDFAQWSIEFADPA